jgi:hypothetical protein
VSEAQRRAAELAQHYFRLIAQQAGVPWDSDNDVEVELMIGLIIDAAAEGICSLEQQTPEPEGICPESSDGRHCSHWHCCACGLASEEGR